MISLNVLFTKQPYKIYSGGTADFFLYLYKLTEISTIFILTIILNILKLVNDENDNFLMRVNQENLLRNKDNRGRTYSEAFKPITYPILYERNLNYDQFIYVSSL